jgi:hypothetical protein
MSAQKTLSLREEKLPVNPPKNLIALQNTLYITATTD